MNEILELINEFNNMFYREDEGFLMDLKKEDYGYQAVCEIPGVKKEDIKLEIENNILTISANKNTQKDKKYILSEISHANYKRSINLADVKVDNIKAKYENGVLTIDIYTIENQVKKYIVE